MEKIIDIIDSIAHEKGLKPDSVKEKVKTAIINTVKKVLGENLEFEVVIDRQKKSAKLFQKLLVVEDSSDLLSKDGDKYIPLHEAKEIDSEVEVGDELRYEINLENLGRTAAAILQKEVEFHIQRLVEDELFKKYNEKVGKIISGTVVRVDNEENTIVEIDEVRAILPKKNRIKGESFKVGNVVKAILQRVRIDKYYGIHLELSRTTPKFLEELLRLEVPEIKDGYVIIEKAARIPGERAKIALSSINPKIDPVGATVGVKGVRINAVSRELKNESIDCIEFSTIPEIFISRAMSPAIIAGVKIEDKRAVVTVPSDQKAKAIGKSGINIRLASMLTGFEIELKEQEAAPVMEKPLAEEPTLKRLEDLFK